MYVSAFILPFILPLPTLQRSLLRALQTLFCPSASSGFGEVGAAITCRCCCFGSELVSQLLCLLSEGTVAASLLANIADTLQALITACYVRLAHPVVNGKSPR
jgi:hypothetical protein